MKFTPQSKEELSALLAEGEGEFKVLECQESVSKSNNPMFVLKVSVADKNGKVATLTDYLATHWKIRNFAHSAGLIEQYNAGEITAKDCLNKEGKCLIKIQKGEMGDRGLYPDKNIVGSYIEQEEKATPAKKQAETFVDDDINF